MARGRLIKYYYRIVAEDKEKKAAEAQARKEEATKAVDETVMPVRSDNKTLALFCLYKSLAYINSTYVHCRTLLSQTKGKVCSSLHSC